MTRALISKVIKEVKIVEIEDENLLYIINLLDKRNLQKQFQVTIQFNQEISFGITAKNQDEEELKQSEIDKLANEEFKNKQSQDPQVTPDGPQQDDSLSKKATIIGDKTSIDSLIEYLNNEVQNEENYREIIEIKD